MSAHALAVDVDRLLSAQGGLGPSRPDWSSVARLLEPLRAEPTPDELAGEGQAILAIAASIRAHPITSPSTPANPRALANRGSRSLAEKVAVSLVAAALAGTTSLVVAGAIPPSGGRMASGLPSTVGIHGRAHPTEPSRSTRSSGSVITRASGERPRVTVAPRPAPAKGRSVGQLAGKSGPVKSDSRSSGSGSGSGSGSHSGTDPGQDGGRTLGGDRGQGKDRGRGNDDRILSGGGHPKDKSSRSRGGHHQS